MSTFTIIRRDDYLPEDRAVREMRRVPHLNAARRVGYEIAYRFFESLALLDREIAHRTVGDILAWDGTEPITVVAAGSRFTLAAQ